MQDSFVMTDEWHAQLNQRCVQCNRLKPLNCLEAVTVGDETFYVCEPCADNLAGPGKHEAVDEDERALCVVLEHLAGVSGEDEMLTDEYSGYVGIFDRFMLVEDERGFVSVREHRDHDAAVRVLQLWEDDGFGAMQEDAWISYTPRGLEVSFDGKHEGTYPRLNRAMAKVSLLMRDRGYYPNVWLAGEHGPSVRRIDVRYLEEKS